MWEARQFVPMLVKTVRGLRNHLGAAVTQDTHEREPIHIHNQNGNLHTHTPKFYFAGSPIKEDIRPMQKRET